MAEGSSSILINRGVADVFNAVTDVTRMGEWSPECRAARWLAPSTGPAAGARFEGDNKARLGPIPLKQWTTTCEVTVYEPDEAFEFVAAGYSTWRFDFERVGEATRVTQSYRHPDYEGWQQFVYERVARRTKVMRAGLETTLTALRDSLE